jgi:hypothetical protein
LQESRLSRRHCPGLRRCNMHTLGVVVKPDSVSR